MNYKLNIWTQSRLPSLRMTLNSGILRNEIIKFRYSDIPIICKFNQENSGCTVTKMCVEIKGNLISICNCHLTKGNVCMYLAWYYLMQTHQRYSVTATYTLNSVEM